MVKSGYSIASNHVTPAKAGVLGLMVRRRGPHGIPAFAGMTILPIGESA